MITYRAVSTKAKETKSGAVGSKFRKGKLRKASATKTEVATHDYAETPKTEPTSTTAETEPKKRSRGRPRTIPYEEPQPKKKAGRKAKTDMEEILAIRPQRQYGARQAGQDTDGNVLALADEVRAVVTGTKKKLGSGTEGARKSRSSAQPADEFLAKILEVMPWRQREAGKKNKGHPPKSVIDSRKVHVISESLCDDTLAYLGNSLDRHQGCDLVDIGPGVGLWSRKLHERLQPRKHILMEPDADLYAPLLKDLTDKPNVELLRQNGILWKDLNDMLDTHLPHQKNVVGTDAAFERNDTLLVTANLSSYPLKAQFGFSSISMMVLHQLISSIHTSSLFNRYGLVRLLIWANNEDKRRILPQGVARRHRFAFVGELGCEWIHEVVGGDAGFVDAANVRDEWINLESACNTAERMAKDGRVMPKGREPDLHLKVLEDPSLKGQKLAGEKPVLLRRPYWEELQGFREETEFEDASTSEGKYVRQRAMFLTTREREDNRRSETYFRLLQERDELQRAHATISAEEFERRSHEWVEKMTSFKKNRYQEFCLARDNYHLFRQDPPAMLWDRRQFEPLIAQNSEFFPSSPCTLLDIQPKAIMPILREHGPKSTRSGDISEILLKSWFAHGRYEIPHMMDALWPGFGGLYEESGCKAAFEDPELGGCVIQGKGGMQARLVNENLWGEIVKAWMEWDFRPEYQTVLGRSLDDGEELNDEEGSGTMGLDGGGD